MKNSKKFILRMIPVVILLLVVFTSGNGLFATGGVDTDYPTGGSEIAGITDLAQNIWTTVTVVAQVIAFIAIIFAGIRYMFASADQKADIKKQTVILVVGAIFVFGASTLVQVIMGLFDQATTGIV